MRITAKILIVVLLCSSAFGKSREYYKETIISGIFDCNTKLGIILIVSKKICHTIR